MSFTAKFKNVLLAINDIAKTAKSRKISHLYLEDNYIDGRLIKIEGELKVNFGICSYLGLDQDQRLKDGAIDAINRYGSQYSSSRTYVSLPLYKELEELLQEMFNAEVVVSPSTTLGHMAVIPIVVEDNDAVIIDQQAHFSMQEQVKNLQLRGIKVRIIRHNNLEELLESYAELKINSEKVWYFIDGVYSMYGDFAPLKELEYYLQTLDKLHLYVDDAHGMSWAGINGTGYVLSQMPLHKKMVLVVSLAKGFGAGGGVFVFPDKELAMSVKYFGGPLSYSGPHQPGSLGSAIASAKIHLSDEIYTMQNELREKIQYCYRLLKENNLPVVSSGESPIFFIGLGLTRVGYNFVRRLLNDGFYTNLGIFPAVPETCTGMRFTLTRHIRKTDIENFVEKLAYHFPRALQEEGRTIKDIKRAFRKICTFDNVANVIPLNKKEEKFVVQHEKSISKIPKDVWNQLLGRNGSFDWDGLEFLEKVFKNNKDPENQWNFHYFIIRDKEGVPVVATFFTACIIKDDMLHSASISAQLEEERKKRPFYMTSRAFMMGSLLSEGQHLFVNRVREDWKEALMKLIDAAWDEQEKERATVLNLRDFDANDKELIEFFADQGFVKVNMPETNIHFNLNWNTEEEFLSILSRKNRKNFKHDIHKYKESFEVEIIEHYTPELIDEWYQLYLNVKNNNLGLNVFDLPKPLFEEISRDPNWEVIQLKLKEEDSKELTSFVFSYKSGVNYIPMLVGLDYKYLNSHKLYKQTLYRVICRAKELGANRIYLGYTSSLEKRKLGATSIPQVALLQIKDSYNVKVLNMMAENLNLYKSSGT